MKSSLFTSLKNYIKRLTKKDGEREREIVCVREREKVRFVWYHMMQWKRIRYREMKRQIEEYRISKYS